MTETATEQAPVQARAELPVHPGAPGSQEPERIIPASPFSVIFQSPDLATDDDDIAPSAATERKQQRRQPRGGAPGGRDGGNRRRMRLSTRWQTQLSSQATERRAPHPRCAPSRVRRQIAALRTNAQDRTGVVRSPVSTR